MNKWPPPGDNLPIMTEEQEARLEWMIQTTYNQALESAAQRVEKLLDRQGWLATAPSMRLEIIAAIKEENND